MKVVIGLGNPEEKFTKNRHNVGYQFIDFVKNQNDGETDKDFKWLKTESFMNISGVMVAKTVGFYKIEISDLIIVHDDLDIPIGQYKIQLGVGPKDHNGVISVEENLGDKNFWRIRIGIENRKSKDEIGYRKPGEEYVLENFLPEEEKILEKIFGEIYAKCKTDFR